MVCYSISPLILVKKILSVVSLLPYLSFDLSLSFGESDLDLFLSTDFDFDFESDLDLSLIQIKYVNLFYFILINKSFIYESFK
jgi:hypothetical protein